MWKIYTSEEKSRCISQIFETGAQKIRKNRYQSFSVVSYFAWFLNLFQNTLHKTEAALKEKNIFRPVTSCSGIRSDEPSLRLGSEGHRDVIMNFKDLDVMVFLVYLLHSLL